MLLMREAAARTAHLRSGNLLMESLVSQPVPDTLDWDSFSLFLHLVSKHVLGVLPDKIIVKSIPDLSEEDTEKNTEGEEMSLAQTPTRIGGDVSTVAQEAEIQPGESELQETRMILTQFSIYSDHIQLDLLKSALYMNSYPRKFIERRLVAEQQNTLTVSVSCRSRCSTAHGAG